MEHVNQHFSKFIGSWQTEGLIPACAEHPEIHISGRDTYEWILDRAFLLHKADVMMGAEQSQTHEIIGYDQLKGCHTMQYFNNKGEQGLMTAKVENEIWYFTGEQLRFTGGFSTDGNIFSGEWEMIGKAGEWVHLMSIKLVKQD